MNTLPWFRPGEVIPDGQGGLLTGWTHVRNVYDYYARTPEARVTRVTPSGLTHYALPLPEWVSWWWSWVPPNRSLVLGEEGVAFGTYGGKVVSFDVASGTVRWVWQAASGEAELVAATAGNGLVVKGGGRVVRLDAYGQATYDDWLGVEPGAIDPATLSQLQYGFGTQWIALQTFPNPGTHPVAISAPAFFWPDSPWPESAIADTRQAIGTIDVAVHKVIQAPMPVDFITERVRSGLIYWRRWGRILFQWDGNILPEDACPQSEPGCPTSILRNILRLSEDHDCTQELYDRFRTERGVHFVFMQAVTYRGDETAYTLAGRDSLGNLAFFNVVAVSAESPDVLPHELGHVFQLEHVVPFAALNLMCAPAFPADPTPCAPWLSRILLPAQIYEARKNAVKLIGAR